MGGSPAVDRASSARSCTNVHDKFSHLGLAHSDRGLKPGHDARGSALSLRYPLAAAIKNIYRKLQNTKYDNNSMLPSQTLLLSSLPLLSQTSWAAGGLPAVRNCSGELWTDATPGTKAPCTLPYRPDALLLERRYLLHTDDVSCYIPVISWNTHAFAGPSSSVRGADYDRGADAICARTVFSGRFRLVIRHHRFPDRFSASRAVFAWTVVIDPS